MLKPHPYKKYEWTKLWSVVAKAVDDLEENQDLVLQTPNVYVISYLIKSLIKANLIVADYRSFDPETAKLLQPYIAITSGNADELQKLIADGMNVNAVDENGDTPLLIACEYGNAKIARLLINNGADINRENEKGMSPVEVAIISGKIEIAKLLINRGCNLSVSQEDYTLMHAVAAIGSVGLGQMLQNKGLSLESIDDSGETPLHRAVLCGQTRFVKWLIDNGVQVDIENENGQIPLQLAIFEGHLKIVELLLEAGSDANHINSVHRGTSLHTAFYMERGKIIELLDKYGAKFDIEDEDGRYPICYAIHYCYKPLVAKYLGRYKDILSDAEKTKIRKISARKGIADIVNQAL